MSLREYLKNILHPSDATQKHSSAKNIPKRHRCWLCSGTDMVTKTKKCTNPFCLKVLETELEKPVEDEETVILP